MQGTPKKESPFLTVKPLGEHGITVSATQAYIDGFKPQQYLSDLRDTPADFLQDSAQKEDDELTKKIEDHPERIPADLGTSIYLNECTDESCKLSRTQNPQFRAFFEDEIVALASTNFKKANKSIVYAGFAAGGLLQDFRTIEQLIRSGTKLSNIIIIDPRFAKFIELCVSQKLQDITHNSLSEVKTEQPAARTYQAYHLAQFSAMLSTLKQTPPCNVVFFDSAKAWKEYCQKNTEYQADLLVGIDFGVESWLIANANRDFHQHATAGVKPGGLVALCAAGQPKVEMCFSQSSADHSLSYLSEYPEHVCDTIKLVDLLNKGAGTNVNAKQLYQKLPGQVDLPLTKWLPQFVSNKQTIYSDFSYQLFSQLVTDILKVRHGGEQKNQSTELAITDFFSDFLSASKNESPAAAKKKQQATQLASEFKFLIDFTLKNVDVEGVDELLPAIFIQYFDYLDDKEKIAKTKRFLSHDNKILRQVGLSFLAKLSKTIYRYQNKVEPFDFANIDGIWRVGKSPSKIDEDFDKNFIQSILSVKAMSLKRIVVVDVENNRVSFDVDNLNDEQVKQLATIAVYNPTFSPIAMTNAILWELLRRKNIDKSYQQELYYHHLLLCLKNSTVEQFFDILYHCEEVMQCDSWFMGFLQPVLDVFRSKHDLDTTFNLITIILQCKHYYQQQYGFYMLDEMAFWLEIEAGKEFAPLSFFSQYNITGKMMDLYKLINTLILTRGVPKDKYARVLLRTLRLINKLTQSEEATLLIIEIYANSHDHNIRYGCAYPLMTYAIENNNTDCLIMVWRSIQTEANEEDLYKEYDLIKKLLNNKPLFTQLVQSHRDDMVTLLAGFKKHDFTPYRFANEEPFNQIGKYMKKATELERRLKLLPEQSDNVEESKPGECFLQ